ncbi:BrnT family toxin [Endothiovibrio diazotrophicus]
MEFQWDPQKEQGNRRKHGIAFVEAVEVFGDEHSICVPDPDHSHGESRYLLFGLSSNGGYLVVSFTERVDAIRIISARRMTRQERKAYEQ